ncbi:hypothetical protein ACFO4N_10825 [Camelliibacillus cellulosilyticus]|uniref:Uncharacterized protein n=1 Tax=Camelliibacillus cellulosilyticus TaxID=2174486 RepID=A0ABV9GLM1_9BACL
MKRLKRPSIVSLSLLLSLTLFAAFTLPSVASAEELYKAQESAKQEAIKTAANVENVTGIEEIQQSSETKSAFNSELTNDTSAVEIPKNPEKPITVSDPLLGDQFVGINLPSNIVDSSANGIKSDDGTIVYDNKDQNVGLAVQPTEDGVRNLINIKDKTAPKIYKFDIDVPEGSRLVKAVDYLGEEFDTGEVFIVDSNNIITSVFTPAWAEDADGSSIPTHYEVEGNTLIQVVDFNENNVFPIVADPNWFKIAACAGAIAWFIGSTIFTAAKIIKVKKYIKALGGVANAAKLMLKATTWEEKLRVGGKALMNLGLELSGIAALKVCF